MYNFEYKSDKSNEREKNHKLKVMNKITNNEDTTQDK